MIRITLGEDILPTVEYEKDGLKRNMTVTHNTLFEFISKNCVEKKAIDKTYDIPVFETPALPENTVKYLALPDGQVAIYMVQKAFQKTVTYHNTKMENVGFPNLLFEFVFSPDEKSMKMVSKKCFAFKADVLREETPLCYFPFSHVQKESGTMCLFLGYEIVDLPQLTSFVHNWLSADFTDHYYHENGMGKNLFNAPMRQVFEECKGKPFDNSKLVESNLTLKTLAKRVIKKYFPQA